jgi:hypothetical protein
LGQFVTLIRRHSVSEVVFSGTTTDPQLYRHEARLLIWLRDRLPPAAVKDQKVRYSLHTNGQLAMRKIEIFNQYDRACISFPSFKSDTYHKMMGSARVPDLAEIVRQAAIPLKISCVINEHNVAEIPEFLDRCGALGLKRLVLRQLYGDPRTWPILSRLPLKSSYRNNPVYDYHGLEVTYWRFDQTDSTSLNLFSDGTISAAYHLTQAKPI